MTFHLDKLLSQVSWKSLKDLPEADDCLNQSATQQGVLKVEDFELYCYRNSDGDLAFDIEDLERFFRGCHACDHPSQCPACNPDEVERSRARTGLIVGEDEEADEI